jgi:hypothetical protein
MLQIYVHGEMESGFLELFPGTVLDMEELTDIFDEDITTGEFSLPLSFPWTEKNRRLLKFAERIENFSSRKNYWEIDAYDDGYPELIRGKLTLLEKSGSFNYTRGSFEASISGNKGLFGSTIKNKKLRDLVLGGIINWTVLDSRVFASYVMKGLFPQYNYIGFAPVAIENFFDKGKNYNDEFLVKDTVNYIVPYPGGDDSWEFARPSSADETVITAPGQPEYIDFRTIPFFNFTYVLKKAFEEIGYSVSGEILDSPTFKDLHIFNTTAIEFYSAVAYMDYTRRITPADHIPDMLLSDFFRAVFSFFNIYPVFDKTHVYLKYRKKIFTDRVILNITKRCNPNFSSTYKEATDDTGYSLEYTWDEKDDYRSDRIKDISTKTLVATVSTLPNLGTLDIGRPFTTDDIVYVEAENMYYNVANAAVIPILWDAWSEGMDSYKKGNGGRSVPLGLGTLCTYVEFIEADALYLRRNRVGCRQIGSYFTNKYVKVRNEFSLRLFYISKQMVDGRNIPVSFNNNTAPAGNEIAPFSLALDGPKGMAKNFHENWQDLQEVNDIVKVTVEADKKFMAELSQANTIEIDNVLFIPQKIESQLPLQGTIDMEIIPL